MFSASAELYDLIYSTIKDYPAEAAALATLLRQAKPRCTTVLDVACGTGEHARLLAAEGFTVDGLDLDPNFVRIARQKHASGRFVVADLTDVRLPARYDAVLCLFSSIGYARTLDRVRDALRCFRRHLTPGGVIVVEPWFPPGALDTTRISRTVVEGPGVRVTSKQPRRGRGTPVAPVLRVRDRGCPRDASCRGSPRTRPVHDRRVARGLLGTRPVRRVRPAGSDRPRVVRRHSARVNRATRCPSRARSRRAWRTGSPPVTAGRHSAKRD